MFRQGLLRQKHTTVPFLLLNILVIIITREFAAMTLGAGVQWHEAYDAVQAQGRVLVGGLSAGGSVGAAGGWAMGGGHSTIAPAYGLGKIQTFLVD